MQRTFWIGLLVLAVGWATVALREPDVTATSTSAKAMQDTSPSAANDEQSANRSSGMSLQARPGGQPIPPSKAPWAQGIRALEARDYRYLVASARSAPESGSYALAARALSMCANVIGGYPKATAEIERSRQHVETRMRALQTLKQACDGLGDEQSMAKLRDTLYLEGERAGDALLMLAKQSDRLLDTKVQRGDRQQQLSELLSLDDPHAFSVVRPVLMAKGAAFDGSPIPDKDRPAYGFALQLAACSHYGACGGADSTAGHRDCALHGECDYYDTMKAAERLMLPALYERAGQYYLKVRHRLVQRDFSAFAPP